MKKISEVGAILGDSPTEEMKSIPVSDKWLLETEGQVLTAWQEEVVAMSKAFEAYHEWLESDDVPEVNNYDRRAFEDISKSRKVRKTKKRGKRK